MTKVYIGELIPNLAHIPLLYPNLGPAKVGGALFTDEVFKFYKEPAVQIVSNPEEADFILLPHVYSKAKRYQSYMVSLLSLSKEKNKPLIIFAYGDKDEDVPYSNTIVFRYSQYRYKKKSNDFIMPAYSSDLLQGELSLRQKKDELPVIGFCGWADYQTNNNLLKASIKHAILDLRKIAQFRPELESRKKGIYFRKKALESLSGSPLVKTNFIIRKSHGLHRATVDFDPEKARLEYIKNTLDSDFCLSVKGDGNASVRFYEILSLGRIPLFIDTESLLPFEDKINYRSLMPWVDYKNIEDAPIIVGKFYASLSNEEFKNIQRKCREVFEKYLRIDSFFKETFRGPEELKKYVR